MCAFFLGVTGTWEGWVPTATDLYLRGNNISGFTTISPYCTFEAGGIKIAGAKSGYFYVASAGNLNYVPYNYLNIQGYFEKRSKTLEKERNVGFAFYANTYGGTTSLIAESKISVPGNSSNFTISINVSNAAISKRSSLCLDIKGEYYYDGNGGEYWTTFERGGWQGYVYRIWFS